MKEIAIKVMDMFASAAIWLSFACGIIVAFGAFSAGQMLYGIAGFIVSVVVGCLVCAGWAVLSGIYHNGIEQNRLLAKIASNGDQK